MCHGKSLLYCVLPFVSLNCTHPKTDVVYEVLESNGSCGDVEIIKFHIYVQHNECTFISVCE